MASERELSTVLSNTLYDLLLIQHENTARGHGVLNELERSIYRIETGLNSKEIAFVKEQVAKFVSKKIKE
ncbi:MAG: hypothetical protein LBE35_09065 [Clostridiales bacterium]|jgi:hypothetical protein|nr:hypothetical protein [Clostridiales bacterium]